ncbi:MAG: hypothetical protein ACNS63_09590 [Candidatus Nitrospinota bacterium M3_3B_026]
MAGQVIKSCTPVKRCFRTRTFPPDFSRSGRGEGADNWWILILIRPNSLIRESDPSTSHPPFSTSFASTSTIFASFSTRPFSRPRPFYLSLLIDFKGERRTGSDEKIQNTHPPVAGVYEKAVHQFPPKKIADWWKVVEVNCLKYLTALIEDTPLPPIHQCAACGGSFWPMVSYRGTLKRRNTLLAANSLTSIIDNSVSLVRNALDGENASCREGETFTHEFLFHRLVRHAHGKG